MPWKNHEILIAAWKQFSFSDCTNTMVSSYIWTNTSLSLSHKIFLGFSLDFYSLKRYVRACILWPFFATSGWKSFQSRHGLTRRRNWNTRKLKSKNMPNRKSDSHCEWFWLWIHLEPGPPSSSKSERPASFSAALTLLFVKFPPPKAPLGMKRVLFIRLPSVKPDTLYLEKKQWILQYLQINQGPFSTDFLQSTVSIGFCDQPLSGVWGR